MLSLVDEAVASGARTKAACERLNVTPRTLERWRKLRAWKRPDEVRLHPDRPAIALKQRKGGVAA